MGVLLIVTLLSFAVYMQTFELLGHSSESSATIGAEADAVVLAVVTDPASGEAQASEMPTTEPTQMPTPTPSTTPTTPAPTPTQTAAPTPSTTTSTTLATAPATTPATTSTKKPTKKPTKTPTPTLSTTTTTPVAAPAATPTKKPTTKPTKKPATTPVPAPANTTATISGKTPVMAPSTTSSAQSLSSRDGSHKRFAYVFYVTSDTYACAALHLMDHLRGLMDASNIELAVLHAPSVSDTMLERLRAIARVIPVDVMRTNGLDPTWQQSLTKLYAFRDWGYDRVVYMDADSVPLESLDHLFELPSAPLHAPRAYWLRQPFFASTLLVIEPSDALFDEIITWARAQGDAAGFDMDILNTFFKDTVEYLPGDYTVLNSDFRATPDAPNKLYATTSELKQNTKLVHFSCTPDGSYGKPWSSANRDMTFATEQGLDPLFAELFGDYWAFETRECA